VETKASDQATVWPGGVGPAGVDVFRRVRKIAKSDCYLRHVCPSAWNNSVPLDGFLWNLKS